MMGNVNIQVETWEETCGVLWMTPHRSPFQSDQAGAGIVVHGRLMWRQALYPQMV